MADKILPRFASFSVLCLLAIYCLFPHTTQTITLKNDIEHQCYENCTNTALHQCQFLGILHNGSHELTGANLTWSIAQKGSNTHTRHQSPFTRTHVHFWPWPSPLSSYKHPSKLWHVPSSNKSHNTLDHLNPVTSAVPFCRPHLANPLPHNRYACMHQGPPLIFQCTIKFHHHQLWHTKHNTPHELARDNKPQGCTPKRVSDVHTGSQSNPRQPCQPYHPLQRQNIRENKNLKNLVSPDNKFPPNNNNSATPKVPHTNYLAPTHYSNSSSPRAKHNTATPNRTPPPSTDNQKSQHHTPQRVFSAIIPRTPCEHATCKRSNNHYQKLPATDLIYQHRLSAVPPTTRDIVSDMHTYKTQLSANSEITQQPENCAVPLSPLHHLMHKITRPKFTQSTPPPPRTTTSFYGAGRHCYQRLTES